MVKIRINIKKEIVKIIHENEGIGTNESFTLFKKTHGKILSNPTYLKKIRELKEDKKIYEIKDTKGHKIKLVSLARKKQIDVIFRDYNREFKNFKSRLDIYDKLKPNLLDEQKICLFANFYTCYWIMVWKLNEIPDFLEKPAIKQLKQDMKDFEPELFVYFLEAGDYTRITRLGEDELTDQYFETIKKIDQILLK
ncbi:hypothetical protein [Nitrosopumilus adriaticus]|uniref:Uncharacterized protein n=1 Tax=Nitrosopumilus adriaticus TaxID=1580092 RepID=A0A0D5C3S7_9ARCH|nr:hypothetical protein [Nitrosopumilus adriaticus]AJW71057.1 hypothetical protein NADRNF5_1371 [Nitrosopumilus adriaticus]